MDIDKAITHALAGMRAQNGRMRIIAENLANADSTGRRPGEDPYRRKIPTFVQKMDEEAGITTVQLGRIKQDTSDFATRYEPNHPAADQDGFVKYPNVDPLSESLDATTARWSYTANLNVVTSARQMIKDTLKLLKV